MFQLQLWRVTWCNREITVPLTKNQTSSVREISNFTFTLPFIVFYTRSVMSWRFSAARVFPRFVVSRSDVILLGAYLMQAWLRLLDSPGDTCTTLLGLRLALAHLSRSAFVVWMTSVWSEVFYGMTATLVGTSFFYDVVNCIPGQLVDVVFCLFINHGGLLPDRFFDSRDLQIPTNCRISYIPWDIHLVSQRLILDHLNLLDVSFCRVALGCGSIQHRRGIMVRYSNLLFPRLRLLYLPTRGLRREAIAFPLLMAYFQLKTWLNQNLWEMWQFCVKC